METCLGVGVVFFWHLISSMGCFDIRSDDKNDKDKRGAILFAPYSVVCFIRICWALRVYVPESGQIV